MWAGLGFPVLLIYGLLVWFPGLCDWMQDVLDGGLVLCSGGFVGLILCTVVFDKLMFVVISLGSFVFCALLGL